MTADLVAVVADVFIAGWLVFTWFYAGEHRRCSVETICPSCGARGETGCRKA